MTVMSSDEELDLLRQKRMQELQRQLAQEQQKTEVQQRMDEQKQNLLRAILTVEARQRLNRIKMVRPEYVQQIELQLIQLFQSGQLRGAIPLPDKAFKKLLEQISSMGRKKEFNIKK